MTEQTTGETTEKTVVRPYGDATGDGMVQVSFTLPLPHDKRAEGAALQLAQKMGLDPALVVHAKAMGPDFTFFVVYGSVRHLVDVSQVQVVEREYPLLSPKEVNTAIKMRLRRKLVVVGACIGTDAHTVGIDAILNIKGFAGEKGLEYYREFKVVNLGAQVPVPDLVQRAVDERADAVLVSQVVTQRDAHLHNTTEMSAAFREALPAHRRPLLVVGGPRFDESATGELGVDRIFGRGTTPTLWSRRQEPPHARSGRRADERRAARADRHPPALRPVRPRPLRGEPRGRRVQPRLLR
jgi:beta-lysine 5,6-aminomutase beta subunit